MKRVGILLGVLALGLAAAFVFLPGAVERAIQGVEPHPPYAISPEAARLHRQLLVADWHSDSLLWDRDLLERSDRGHVDFPRLAEGNVAIQMFTVATKSPRGQNYERNTGESDNLTALAVVQAWPPRTWSSVLQRALYQAERLEGFVARAPARVVWVRNVQDLRRAMHLRRQPAEGEPPVAVLLGLEGAHALEGDVSNVDVLFEAGYRMVGLHHFFDNELGGSLHGESGADLTDFGREVVRRLEARGILIDLAHSSEAVVDEVLAMATRPVVVSHTGVAGTCPSARNISDEHVRRITAAGGIIAIGYWEGAVCDISPQGVVKAIRHAIDLAGSEHVALGSDFDGGTLTSFDTSELAILTQSMLEAGFEEPEIRRVMGQNTLDFLLAWLPPGPERMPMGAAR
jgi:membrane dipeptidase